jgi:cathepsin L
MKLALVVLSAVFACTYGATNFDDWKAKHGKDYNGTGKSEDDAKSAFNKTVAAIVKHNADPAATYKQGTNENSDMTDNEKQQRNGFKATTKTHNAVKAIPKSVHASTTIPPSFNVTNLMPPVVNQGVCGCCYEMATMAIIDGVNKRNSTQYKTPAMTFSDQQVLDCDLYDAACSGGNPGNVFEFAYETGLVQTANYAALTSPKTNKAGTCNTKAPIAWHLAAAGYADLTSQGLETTLQQVVYALGPAVVSMDANDPALSNYKSGVYSPAAGKCSSAIASANHVVVITGYGTDPVTKLNYWIVRNSWGTSWGMGGYMWMKRGTNACGIGNQVWVVG